MWCHFNRVYSSNVLPKHHVFRHPQSYSWKWHQHYYHQWHRRSRHRPKHFDGWSECHHLCDDFSRVLFQKLQWFRYRRSSGSLLPTSSHCHGRSWRLSVNFRTNDRQWSQLCLLRGTIIWPESAVLFCLKPGLVEFRSGGLSVLGSSGSSVIKELRRFGFEKQKPTRKPKKINFRPWCTLHRNLITSVQRAPRPKTFNIFGASENVKNFYANYKLSEEEWFSNVTECCTSFKAITPTNSPSCKKFVSTSRIYNQNDINNSTFATVTIEYDLSPTNLAMIGTFTGPSDWLPLLIIDDVIRCTE